MSENKIIGDHYILFIVTKNIKRKIAKYKNIYIVIVNFNRFVENVVLTNKL